METEIISYKTKYNKVLKFIVRYNILQDGKHVENNIKTWQQALAHAEKYKSNIFNKHKVEILNLWTGEIVELEEAKSEP